VYTSLNYHSHLTLFLNTTSKPLSLEKHCQNWFGNLLLCQVLEDTPPLCVCVDMHTCTHTGGFPKGFLNLRVLLGYLIAQATYTWLWQQCIGSPSFSRSLTVKATGVSKMTHFVKAHHLRPGLCPTCLPPQRAGRRRLWLSPWLPKISSSPSVLAGTHQAQEVGVAWTSWKAKHISTLMCQTESPGYRQPLS
jgi:hypothetical protein